MNSLLLVPRARASRHAALFILGHEMLIEISLTWRHAERLQHGISPINGSANESSTPLLAHSLVVTLLDSPDPIMVAWLCLNFESLELGHAGVGPAAPTFPVLHKTDPLTRLLCVDPEPISILIERSDLCTISLRTTVAS